MQIVSLFILAIIPVITMIIGFYFGFRIGKDKEIPEVKTPTQIVEEHKEKVEQKREENIVNTYIDNIESYPYNQKDYEE